MTDSLVDQTLLGNWFISCVHVGKSAMRRRWKLRSSHVSHCDKTLNRTMKMSGHLILALLALFVRMQHQYSRICARWKEGYRVSQQVLNKKITEGKKIVKFCLHSGTANFPSIWRFFCVCLMFWLKLIGTPCMLAYQESDLKVIKKGFIFCAKIIFFFRHCSIRLHDIIQKRVL